MVYLITSGNYEQYGVSEIIDSPIQLTKAEIDKVHEVLSAWWKGREWKTPQEMDKVRRESEKFKVQLYRDMLEAQVLDYEEIHIK